MAPLLFVSVKSGPQPKEYFIGTTAALMRRSPRRFPLLSRSAGAMRVVWTALIPATVFCWGEDDRCLRTIMRKIDRREET